MECKVSGCGRPVRATGLCRTHYRWKQEGKPFNRPIRSNPYLIDCPVPYCPRKAVRWDSYCLECNRRWKRRGGPLAPIVKKDRVIDASGYERWYPSHPLNNSGRTRYAHQVVMENSLGRALFPGENVHHKNGDRQDNRLENLELWTTSQPSGQRVEDKIAWAKEFLAQYGER